MKDLFKLLNPTDNAAIVAGLDRRTLYTITLGERAWQTTSSREAYHFTLAFDKLDGFGMSSKPYEGKEIANVINIR